MNFAIDIKRVSGIEMELERERKNLEASCNIVSSVRRGNAFSGSAKQKIINALNTILREMEEEKRGFLRLEDSLAEIRQTYKMYEEKIARVEFGTSVQWGNDIIGNTIIGGGVITEIGDVVYEDTEKDSVWSWGDTWNLISKLGIFGGVISTVGGTVTEDRHVLEFLKGITGVIGDVASAWDKTDQIWEYMFGLNDAFGGEIDMSSAKNAFTTSFKKNFTDLALDTGAEVTKKVEVVCKWAGHILTVVTNGFDNYDEYQEKKGEGFSIGRAVAETTIESAADIGLGFAATAGITTIAAALGITAAPAVAVGIASAVVVWGVNGICKWATGGRDIGEVLADGVCDIAEGIGNGVKKAVEGVSAAWHNICSIFQ